MSERGLSLAESVVAIAVTVILIGIGVPTLLRTFESAEERETLGKLDEVRAGLATFYRDFGRFPDTGEGLEVLVTDSGASAWKGPYVPLGAGPASALSDGRGKPFEYRLTGDVATVTVLSDARLTTSIAAGPVAHEAVDAARRELARLNDVAETFRAATGAYPGVVSDLAPYVGADPRTDPWARDYVVDSSRQTFFSAGPDGIAGNRDDVFAVGL